MDEARRRDKIDDALLFVMGSIGILFGLIQVFVGTSTFLLQIIAPVGLLGWGLPFYFGYIRGSINDSMVDRYRGWIYLVVGLSLYTVILGEEELSRVITDPGLEWVIPVASAPFLILLVLALGRFRRFVLGPTAPENRVLSQSAFNAVTTAAVIALFGSFFAIGKFQETLPALIVALVLVSIATIVAGIFMHRSRFYARRINWPYKIVKRNGRYFGHHRVGLTKRILSIIALVLALSGAVIVIVARNFAIDPTWTFAGEGLLGWAFILLFPLAVLARLTRSGEIIDFDGPFDEKPPLEDSI